MIPVLIVLLGGSSFFQCPEAQASIHLPRQTEIFEKFGVEIFSANVFENKRIRKSVPLQLISITCRIWVWYFQREGRWVMVSNVIPEALAVWYISPLIWRRTKLWHDIIDQFRKVKLLIYYVRKIIYTYEFITFNIYRNSRCAFIK